MRASMLTMRTRAGSARALNSAAVAWASAVVSSSSRGRQQAMGVSSRERSTFIDVYRSTIDRRLSMSRAHPHECDTRPVNTLDSAAALEKTIERYNSAWNDHDVDTILTFHAP